jgi:hypothetical protein
VLDRLKFGERTSAALLSQIYPFSEFLRDGKQIIEHYELSITIGASEIGHSDESCVKRLSDNLLGTPQDSAVEGSHVGLLLCDFLLRCIENCKI